MNHHLYDHLLNTWIKQRSKPQPFISKCQSVSVTKVDYNALGLAYSSKPTMVSTVTDTGCQCCLVGFSVTNKLGLKLIDVISDTLKMHDAYGTKSIYLEPPLRITGTNDHGDKTETRQMTSKTSCFDELFLS